MPVYPHVNPMSLEEQFLRPLMTYIVKITVYGADGVHAEEVEAKAYDQQQAIDLAKAEVQKKHKYIDFLSIHSANQKGS